MHETWVRDSHCAGVINTFMGRMQIFLMQCCGYWNNCVKHERGSNCIDTLPWRSTMRLRFSLRIVFSAFLPLLCKNNTYMFTEFLNISIIANFIQTISADPSEIVFCFLIHGSQGLHVLAMRKRFSPLAIKGTCFGLKCKKVVTGITNVLSSLSRAIIESVVSQFFF